MHDCVNPKCASLSAISTCVYVHYRVEFIDMYPYFRQTNSDAFDRLLPLAKAHALQNCAPLSSSAPLAFSMVGLPASSYERGLRLVRRGRSVVGGGSEQRQGEVGRSVEGGGGGGGEERVSLREARRKVRCL